jgi:hypothetical protein
MQKPDSYKKEYSYLEVECALCIYECFIESLIKRKKADKSAFDNWLIQYRKDNGIAQVRNLAINLSVGIDKAWLKIQDDYHDSFDWEFIPKILHKAFDKDQELDHTLSDEIWDQFANELVKEQAIDKG